MRLFEIKTPDGRVLRQSHPDIDHVKARLMPGYEVVGEVFGADANGSGGMVDVFAGEPLMARLLSGRNGEFLREWLDAGKSL